ncbi:MAG: HU family DNA-binding protein [Prevotellaceae bacterium]|nr:HU family DNA-binding protein [Prevotellaceae bacterium]
MSVNYVVVERGNPANPQAPKKWYAQGKSVGELTYKQLGKEIAEGGTTVNDTDVLAVLNDLTKVVRRHLSNGEIVRLGDFGSFQVAITSKGAESEAAFNASLMEPAKVTFRPGSDLKDMLKTLSYTKA